MASNTFMIIYGKWKTETETENENHPALVMCQPNNMLGIRSLVGSNLIFLMWQRDNKQTQQQQQ